LDDDLLDVHLLLGGDLSKQQLLGQFSGKYKLTRFAGFKNVSVFRSPQVEMLISGHQKPKFMLGNALASRLGKARLIKECDRQDRGHLTATLQCTYLNLD